MKFITEEEHKKMLDEVNKIGWTEYFNKYPINENSNNELVVVQIKGSISDYSERNGYINADEAMKIIEKMRQM